MQITIREPGSAITHFIAMMMAVFAAVPLLIKAGIQSGQENLLAMAIFMGSMILLYGASATYHSVDLTGRSLRIFRKLDHMMIFVLIAGSYTPVCLIVLGGKLGYTLLALVWGIAAVGMLIKAFWITCPKWFSSIIYIAMGWVCVLAAFPFALCGFFQYNGMTLERFLLAYIRSEFLFPRRLVFKSDNIYAKALENSTIKEALKLD